VPPLDALSQAFSVTIISWFLVGIVDDLTAGWTRRKAAGVALVLLFGLAAAGLRGIDSLPQWVAAGMLIAAFGLAAYLFVFRAAPTVLPIVAVTLSALGAVKAGLSGAYPGVMLSSVLRVVMLAAAAWLLVWLWQRRGGAAAQVKEQVP
jgi:hypothetical protein